LRGTRKLLSIVVGLGALASIGITSIPAGQAQGSPTDALRARRAQLLQQLAALEPAKNSAASALAAAENAFAAEQAQLLSAQQRLAAINARLLALSGQIADDQATIVRAKQDLGTLTRQTYESTTTNSWVAAVLSATTFNQAMDRLAGTSHVAEQVRNLQASVRAKQDAITAEKTEIQKDAATTVALEGQLAADSNALLMLVDAGHRDTDRQRRCADCRRQRAAPTVWSQPGVLRQPFRLRTVHLVCRHPSLHPLGRQRQGLVRQRGQDGIPRGAHARGRRRGDLLAGW
jgi:peptidoglycan hydrolase CwlO-like protein